MVSHRRVFFDLIIVVRMLQQDACNNCNIESKNYLIIVYFNIFVDFIHFFPLMFLSLGMGMLERDERGDSMETVQHYLQHLSCAFFF